MHREAPHCPGCWCRSHTQGGRRRGRPAGLRQPHALSLAPCLSPAGPPALRARRRRRRGGGAVSPDCDVAVPSRWPPPEAAGGAGRRSCHLCHLRSAPRRDRRAVAGGSFPRCHQLRGRARSEGVFPFQVLLDSNRPHSDKGSSWRFEATGTCWGAVLDGGSSRGLGKGAAQRPAWALGSCRGPAGRWRWQKRKASARGPGWLRLSWPSCMEAWPRPLSPKVRNSCSDSCWWRGW